MFGSKQRRKPVPTQTLWWFIEYTVAWSVLWWLLSRGQATSWLVGGPTVLAAAGMSVWLSPKWGWHWTVGGMVRFIWHFGRVSLSGGIDAAWRAIHPQLPIEPQMIEYHARLPAGTARVFFANAISLCPGTVSASMRGCVLTIHVLDARQPVHQQLAELERAVAILFDVPWEPGDGSPNVRDGGAS
jgi:multicomponent Na+:H+ antiporter subunit E